MTKKAELCVTKLYADEPHPDQVMILSCYVIDFHPVGWLKAEKSVMYTARDLDASMGVIVRRLRTEYRKIFKHSLSTNPASVKAQFIIRYLYPNEEERKSEWEFSRD